MYVLRIVVLKTGVYADVRLRREYKTLAAAKGAFTRFIREQNKAGYRTPETMEREPNVKTRKFQRINVETENLCGTISAVLIEESPSWTLPRNVTHELRLPEFKS